MVRCWSDLHASGLHQQKAGPGNQRRRSQHRKTRLGPGNCFFLRLLLVSLYMSLFVQQFVNWILLPVVLLHLLLVSLYMSLFVQQFVKWILPWMLTETPVRRPVDCPLHIWLRNQQRSLILSLWIISWNPFPPPLPQSSLWRLNAEMKRIADLYETWSPAGHVLTFLGKNKSYNRILFTVLIPSKKDQKHWRTRLDSFTTIFYMQLCSPIHV